MSTDSAKANFVSCTFENNVGRAPTTGGGAVWLNESTVSFQSCTWTNNNSLTYGGALVSSRSRVFIGVTVSPGIAAILRDTPAFPPAAPFTPMALSSASITLALKITRPAMSAAPSTPLAPGNNRFPIQPRTCW